MCAVSYTHLDVYKRQDLILAREYYAHARARFHKLSGSNWWTSTLAKPYSPFHSLNKVLNLLEKKKPRTVRDLRWGNLSLPFVRSLTLGQSNKVCEAYVLSATFALRAAECTIGRFRKRSWQTEKRPAGALCDFAHNGNFCAPVQTCLLYTSRCV